MTQKLTLRIRTTCTYCTWIILFYSKQSLGVKVQERDELLDCSLNILRPHHQNISSTVAEGGGGGGGGGGDKKQRVRTREYRGTVECGHLEVRLPSVISIVTHEQGNLIRSGHHLWVPQVIHCTRAIYKCFILCWKKMVLHYNPQQKKLGQDS